MFEYFEGEKEKKKSMTADQKKQYVHLSNELTI